MHNQTNRGIRGRAIAALIAIAAIGLTTATTQAATLVNGVAVSIEGQPTSFSSAETYHGYVEYRVHLVNRTSQTRNVTLRLPDSAYGTGSDSISQIARNLSLAANTGTTVSLLQPPVRMNGHGLEVRVDGVRETLNVDFAQHMQYRHGYHGHSIRPPAVLMSKAVDPDFRNRAKMHAAGGLPDLLFFQQEIAPGQWSDNWLGYSRYDGIVLTADDLPAMGEPVLEALRRYVAVGGSLAVLGDWQSPESWRRRAFGFDPATRTDNIQTGWLGFGVILGIDELRAASINATQYDRLGQTWRANAGAWSSTRDVAQANRDFPVVDQITVPANGLLVLMITFAVVIGPVNLWVLGRKRRRMWLLWTVPAISLVTCLLIWVYAVTAEGFGADRRVASITVLDQRPDHQTAATIGWAAYYAPLTPGGGLTFDPHTELTPQLGNNPWHRDGGRSRSINLTHGQNLDTGWVIARVPAHFMIRKPHTQVRERLVLKPAPDGNGYVATNGLGANLVRVYYADDTGAVFEAVGSTDSPAARAGDTVDLRPSNDSVQSGAPEWRQLATQDWIDSFRQLRGHNPPQLRPNTYVAVLDGNPFVEPGLEGAHVRQAEAFVIGIVESSTQAHPGATP